MRILLLIDWFLYYSVELANALAEAHEVLLITRDHAFEISSPGDPVGLEQFLGEVLDSRIKTGCLRYRRGDWRSVTEIVRLRRVIRRFDPEVIHIQDTTDWRIVGLALLERERKVVLTVHDVHTHVGESRGWQMLLHHRLIARANGVIVHGDFLKQQFQGAYPKMSDKVWSAQHGAFALYKRWDDGTIAEEDKTALFFGRISPYKGIDVLIRAWRIVEKRCLGCKLILAGQGQDFAPYARMIGSSSAFEVHNRFVPHAEVHRLFRRASVVVLPYIEASQSGVLAMAYAFGKPVVVTDVGSLSEMVEDGPTGLIVPPSDPQALANALARLLSDRDLRQRMKKRISERAATELSWKAVGTRTVEIYRAVLAR